MTASPTTIPVSVTVLLGTGTTSAEIAHATLEVPATVTVTADAGVVVNMDDDVCNGLLADVLEQIATEIRQTTDDESH